MGRELDLCDKYDAMRCVYEDECGSGLGVPTSADGGTLRCVHCGEQWEACEGAYY